MKKHPLFTLIATTLAIATLFLAAPAQAGNRNDRECIDVVRAAGDWGKTLNPGNSLFIADTTGVNESKAIVIRPGEVYCGLGGNDIVSVNDGWFYGGDGVDTVYVNNGVVRGGPKGDVVIANYGVFEGGDDVAADIVHSNYAGGVFRGGFGNDHVDIANHGVFDGGWGDKDSFDGNPVDNDGICIDVETCPRS